ncbi:MAG: hypothetical protein FJW99_08725 [Actinobacteria bacterium]|nr:hypothetical protein [Actinomycetota bacterium]MBM3697469.1 hypothetical protein [Actinomycetota bacterium]
MRARLATLLIALAVACGAATPAMAAPNDVIADYFVDGQLNGSYSVEDLRAALAFAQDRVGTGAQYSAFADIISQAITGDLAGTSGAAKEQLKAQEPRTRTQTTPAPDPTATVVQDDGLPTPPPSDPADELPAAVPIMGFVALGLVALGSVSAIWRRRRR